MWKHHISGKPNVCRTAATVTAYCAICGLDWTLNQVVPKFGMRGALTPLSLYAFMGRTQTFTFVIPMRRSTQVENNWCRNFFPPMARQPLGGLGHLIFRGFTIKHTLFLDTPHPVGLLWTRDQLVAETSTWQHTTLTRNRHYRCILHYKKTITKPSNTVITKQQPHNII
jgi:hypothetical protein